jgi:hypothetical protein
MARPSVREKVSQSLKAMGHRPAVMGGNGRGMTRPQAALLEALAAQGVEMVAEHAVSGWGRVPGYPNHYKLDLASPALMLGVEVDGFSHAARSRQAQDRKKEHWLGEHGWRVLRFTNQEVTEHLADCVQTVMSTISRSRGITTTSQKES